MAETTVKSFWSLGIDRIAKEIQDYLQERGLSHSDAQIAITSHVVQSVEGRGMSERFFALVIHNG